MDDREGTPILISEHREELSPVNEELPSTPSRSDNNNKQKHKDWLAIGGIGIEKRRRPSETSYRLENNKVSICIKTYHTK